MRGKDEWIELGAEAGVDPVPDGRGVESSYRCAVNFVDEDALTVLRHSKRVDTRVDMAGGLPIAQNATRPGDEPVTLLDGPFAPRAGHVEPLAERAALDGSRR